MKFVICLVLLLCSAAFAQEAVVVELSANEAATSKKLYEAKIAADKAWDDQYAKIKATHRDLVYSFDFSKDFRFVVPKSGLSIPSGTLATWSCPYTNTAPTGTATFN